MEKKLIINYPLGIGARWDYSIKMMSPSGTIEGKYIMRVDGIEEIEAELPSGDKITEEFFKVTTLVSGIPGMDNKIEYYRKFEDGLYITNESDSNRSLSKFMPLPIKIGETFESDFKQKQIGSLTINWTIEGFEYLEHLDEDGNIKKYENCLKINGIVQKYNITITLYFAPNLGLAKIVASFPGFVGMEIVLQKYSKGKEGALSINLN